MQTDKSVITNLIKTKNYEDCLKIINEINKTDKSKYFFQKMYCFYKKREYSKVIKKIKRRPELLGQEKYQLLLSQCFYNKNKFEESSMIMENILKSKTNKKNISEEFLINFSAIDALKNLDILLFEKNNQKNDFIGKLKKEITFSEEGKAEFQFNECFYDLNNFLKSENIENNLIKEQQSILREERTSEIKNLKLFQKRIFKIQENLNFDKKSLEMKELNKIMKLLEEPLFPNILRKNGKFFIFKSKMFNKIQKLLFDFSLKRNEESFSLRVKDILSKI